MTYNIRHACPPTQPDKIDVDTIAAVIRNCGADVVALQEVDVHTGRSGKGLHQAKAIGELAGMYHYFGKAINYDGGEYGIAILSKFPIDSAKTYALPSANERAERRAVVLAWLNLGANRTMLIACTHLDAEAGDDSRILQLKTIDSLLMPQPYPLLLAGDLNSEAGDQVINQLDTHFTRTCVINCPYSFSSDKPSKTIDFIAYRSTDPFLVSNHRVLQEPYPSDHLPLMAELVLSFTKSGLKKKGQREE